MNSTIKTNLIKIFEYLAARKDLTTQQPRDLRQDAREFCLWRADLPEGNGCWWEGRGPTHNAWLEIQKQTATLPPTPPEPLRAWLLEGGFDPLQPPTRRDTLLETQLIAKNAAADFLVRSNIAPASAALEQAADAALTFTLAEEHETAPLQTSTNGKSEVAFEGDPERVALWENWRMREWQNWAENALAQQRVQHAYALLFELYQRLQREGDQIELLFGNGLLAWQTETHTIFRPLLVTRAELLFDAESKRFVVVPVEPSAALELDMLSGIALAHTERLSEVEARLREAQPHVLPKAELREWVTALSEDAELLLEEMHHGAQIVPSATPRLFHAPLLFTRSRAGQHWQDDFRGLIAAIQNDHPIASSLAALATPTPLAPTESARQKWLPLAEQIYFPLPANEEQKEIARRLAQHFGVAVQGPPGTGKSHTIVNLLAHLLAHGKRVLVTSQTDRALRVLGEMIRQRLPELAPLCVPQMASTAHATAELQEALAAIYEKLAAFEETAAESALQKAEVELQACREELARRREELVVAAVAENETVFIQGREMNAMQVAQWLTQYEAEYGWMPDAIAAESEPPLSESEFVRLQELLATFSAETLQLLTQHLPRLEDLPTAAETAQYCAQLVAHESEAPQREAALRGWLLPAHLPADLPQKIALVERALRKLESFTAPWLRSILQDVAFGGQREEHWQNFARECRVQLRSIRAAEKALAHFSIAAPLAYDVKSVRADVSLLYEELTKNQSVGLRFRYGRNKNALRVSEQFRLNGNAPRTAEDMLVLLRYLDVEENKRKFWALWANAMREVGGPLPDEEEEQLLKLIEEQLRILEPVLGWNHTYLRALVAGFDQIKPEGPPAWQEVEWLRNYRAGLLAFVQYHAAAPLYDFFQTWSEFLRAGMAQEHAHVLWARLLEALEARNAEAWEAALQDVQQCHALLPQLRELQTLREKLRNVAPRWLAEIEKQPEARVPMHWRAAWEWRRVHAWYEQQCAQAEAEATHERFLAAQAQEARLLESVIAQRAWLQLAQRITSEQKSALYAWLKTTQAVAGQNERVLQKVYHNEATQLLQKCRLAPVWIMPLERVLENFAPTEEKFDVLIVDESSQCPLEALSAWFRAERVIIIGDDKQVSPEAASETQTQVHELIARRLNALPNASTAMWDLHASLFDQAQAAFAPAQQSLILREHFRCAPQIIRFSNEQFYDEKIEPLRLPLPHERLEPALMAVRVTEGQWEETDAGPINPREAEALADKIVELCGDERYAERSLGVISLQGMAHAELIAALLRERLTAEEIMRRRLVCGEAKHFQGDEREVMLLSLVVSAEPQPQPLTQRFEAQRFNVATSRARHQLLVFHSFALEDIPPQCLRHRLLAHCLNPARAEEAARSAQETFAHYGTSSFVREVYEQLHAHGYRVTPEVAIGTHPYRLDLVVEGRHARLGIICEGNAWHGREQWEEEFERQLVLARVGWKFFRVRGSVFYRNPEHALAPLWKTLANLGIKPSLLPEALEEIFAD